MYNGNQQAMQPLAPAAPRRDGQQGTHIVSGIPFSHHGTQGSVRAAPGRPGDGQLVNASETYHGSPPMQPLQSANPNRQLTQACPPPRQIVLRDSASVPAVGTMMPYPHPTMQRRASQPVPPPPPHRSVSGPSSHPHSHYRQPIAGPSHLQMSQGQHHHLPVNEPAPPPSSSHVPHSQSNVHQGQHHHQPAPPPAPSSHVQHSLVSVHHHMGQAHAQEMQRLRQQAQSAPGPPPAPAPSSSHTSARPPSPTQPSAAAPVPSSSAPAPPTQPAQPRSQASNTPPDSGSSGPLGALEAISRSANAQAQQFLEPARVAAVEGLSRTHQNFANELARLYTMISQRDAHVRQLQDRYAHETAARQRAEQEREEARGQKRRAEEDSRKMSEHVARMLMENYEMRRRQEQLEQELASLREANSQLREKTVVVEADEGGTPFELPEEKALVKTEDRLASYRPRVKTEVEAESDAARAAGDYDSEIAQVLATAYEERKRRERAERDLEVVKTILQAQTRQTPASETTVSDYVPPTPAPEAELDMLEAAFAESLSTSSDTVVDDAPSSNDIQAEGTPACVDMVTDAPVAPPPPLKTEQQDEDVQMSWLTSEQIVDLAGVIEASPMQIPIDLPPPTSVSQEVALPERKRSMDVGTEGRRPSPKRRRTMDFVSGITSDMEEGEVPSPSPSVRDGTPEDGQLTTVHTPQNNTPVVDPSPTPVESVDATPPADASRRNATPSAPSEAVPPPTSATPTLSALYDLSLPPSHTVAQPPLQLMTPTSPTMPVPPPAPSSPKKLSMRHIPLIYDIARGRMSCRICQARCAKFRGDDGLPAEKRPKPYVLDERTATWADMAGHCERVHPMAFERLVNMTPDQMREKEHEFGVRRRYG